jgi:hypothetical protein
VTSPFESFVHFVGFSFLGELFYDQGNEKIQWHRIGWSDAHSVVLVQMQGF